MGVQPYIYFNGNCRDAVEFYAAVFETEAAEIMTFGDLPPSPEMGLPGESGHLVLHAKLNIMGTNVLFSDAFPDTTFVEGNNVTLAVMSNNMDEIKRLFNSLKEGGKVDMELQETFWSKCYGSLKDKFGVGWQLSHEE